MTRIVEFLPQAKRQLYEAALWWREHRSAQTAARWLTGMDRAIANLGTDPERFPLAAEAEVLGMPLQQFNFGLSRRPTHRVVFAVEDDKVIIYAIRHLAQQELTSDDLA